jgi:hypothetical protein
MGQESNWPVLSGISRTIQLLDNTNTDPVVDLHLQDREKSDEMLKNMESLSSISIDNHFG